VNISQEGLSKTLITGEKTRALQNLQIYWKFIASSAGITVERLGYLVLGFLFKRWKRGNGREGGESLSLLHRNPKAKRSCLRRRIGNLLVSKV